MNEQTYRVAWYRGEYLHGWLVTEDADALEAAGVAAYMAGWGMRITDEVLRALNADAPAQPQEGDSIEFSQLDVERVATLMREARERRATTRANQTMVDCNCGHRVPLFPGMSSSRGTCCPDCYDRMSQ